MRRKRGLPEKQNEPKADTSTNSASAESPVEKRLDELKRNLPPVLRKEFYSDEGFLFEEVPNRSMTPRTPVVTRNTAGESPDFEHGTEERIGESELERLVTIQAEDAKAYEQESSEKEQIDADFSLLKDLSNKVLKAVKSLENDFGRIWEDAGLTVELDNDVPEALETHLSNRRESLDLCLKMLSRLDRVFPQFDEIIGKEEDVSPLNMIQWDQEPVFKATQGEDLETEEAQLKERIEIEAVRNHNYHLLRQKRELLDQLKDFFFNFFRRHFLPIVDGLDSGRKFFEDHRSEWLTQFADHAELIQQRAGIYEQLIDTTHAFLEGLSIEQISVRRGDRFDEQKHDPFMVEEDAQLQTNQIKEVNQKGYQFTDPQTKTVHIIRLPKVVVVKNR